VEAVAERLGNSPQRRRDTEQKTKAKKPRAQRVTESTEKLKGLTERIIGAAIEVHRQTGPGLMESAYEECLCCELSQMGIKFERQVQLPITYKGVKLDCGYKMDLVVEDSVVLELKTVDKLLPIHTAQLLTYLKLSGKRVGLLLNFHAPILTKGIKRLINDVSVPSGTCVRSGFDFKESASLRLCGERLFFSVPSAISVLSGFCFRNSVSLCLCGESCFPGEVEAS
jgi:GxxExxY protein